MYAPTDGFDFPIILNSKDGFGNPGKEDEVKSNTKAQFTYTFPERFRFGPNWGITLKSVTFNNAIVNYDGMERRLEDAMEEYTSDMVGGVRTPYLHPTGVESTDPITALPPIDLVFDVSFLKCVESKKGKGDNVWLGNPPMTRIPCHLQPDEDDPKHYDLRKACQDINTKLGEFRVPRRTPLPYTTEEQSAKIIIYHENGTHLVAPHYVNKDLQSWSDVKEWLEKKMSRILGRDDAMGVNRDGHFYFHSHPGARLVLIQGQEQTPENFADTIAHFGMTLSTIPAPILPGNTDNLKQDVGDRQFALLSIPTGSNPRAEIAPLPFISERIIPGHFTKYNFDDYDKVYLRMHSAMSTTILPVSVTHLMQAKTTGEFLDILFNKSNNTIHARLNDEGKVELYHVHPEGPVTNLMIIAPEGILRDGLGCTHYILETSERPGMSEIQIVGNEKHVFAEKPKFISNPYGTLSTYIEAKYDEDRPDELSWHMTQDVNKYGHGIMVRPLDGKQLLCDSVPVSMLNKAFLEAHKDIMTPSDQERLMYALQPEDVSAVMAFRNMTEYKDPRDLVRENDLSFSIRAYTLSDYKATDWTQSAAEEVAGKKGYRLDLAVQCKLRSPSCFNTHDVMIEAFMRAVDVGLCDMPEKYVNSRTENLRAKDIVNITFDKSRTRFLFTCGKKYDLVEVALSPLVGGLFGFPLYEDSMVRVMKRHKNATPSRGSSRLSHQGACWLTPSYTRRYKVQTEEESKFPANLSLGTGFLRVRSDLVDDVTLVGGRRQNILGTVPIDWTKTGYDGKSPATSTYLPLKNREFGQATIHLEDQNGELINFLGNDLWPVEVELVASSTRR